MKKSYGQTYDVQKMTKRAHWDLWFSSGPLKNAPAHSNLMIYCTTCKMGDQKVCGLAL